ncbi:amidase [Peribacillus deserti]|uniref:Amidase n=1 Tax=Peribacillus deserti TaxID=673318 RepID=A0ABS2QEU7_9BACI|nr:acetamidase/formamidase family protein [Peribacillus deserti]MBM7691666.1 amidase [Peribacillus deserti]
MSVTSSAKIPKDKTILMFSPSNQPVHSAPSGSTITFETCDCFSNQIQSEDQPFSSVGWDKINPATGPLFVEGAEPGDTLKVEIQSISIADKGVMTVAPKMGVLGDSIKEEKTKITPIENGKALFNDQIQIPIRPMIGVIGTSPAKEEIPSGTPGQHGGNMDCKRIVEGAVLYLPVHVPGALLAMGDLHAVMGDGEVIICGLEVPGEVTVRVTVVKDQRLPLPMLVEGDHIMTIASSETLDSAAKQATTLMHSFLTNELGMDFNEAGMLLSLIGDLRICQVVDPLMTARMELPLSVLANYQYQLV